MIRNGWIIDVDYSNGEDTVEVEKTVETNCLQSAYGQFYGYKKGESVGSIAATFKGSGKGILKYNNCNNTGQVLVYLNGLVIDKRDMVSFGEYSSGLSGMSFQFRKGDFLEIKEQNMAIIQLESLIILNGGNYLI